MNILWTMRAELMIFIDDIFPSMVSISVKISICVYRIIKYVDTFNG